MDYDDNDIQSNNLELAGEIASKSSSVLRPFAFPRFDFDENLPGHLRFDSLVETEAYLGIQGQEDNHWIEDYSRGNSVIEFSSSATDSCSISRRHNVWSEATSSESVEMLLKSVGQEQLVPSESVIDSTATCNDLDRLAKQMEAIRDQDNRSSGHPRAPDDTMRSHELLSDLPVLKDIIEGEGSQNQGASVSQDSLQPACDDSGHLVANVSKEKFEAVATKSDLVVENECGDSGKETHCPEVESLKYQDEENSSDPAVSSHDAGTSLGTLSSESQQEVWDPNCEHSGGLSSDVDEGMNLLVSSEADIHTMKQPAVGDSLPTAGTSVCSGSKVDADNVEQIVASSRTDVDEVMNLLVSSEADIHTMKQPAVGDSLHTAGTSVCSGSKVDADNVEQIVASSRTDVDEGMNLLVSSEADIHTMKQPAVGDSLHTAVISVCSGSKVDTDNVEQIVASSRTVSAAVSSIEELLPKESGKAASCMSPSQPGAGNVNNLCTGAIVVAVNEFSDSATDSKARAAVEGLCSSSEPQEDSFMQLDHGVSREILGNLEENILDKGNETTVSIHELSPVREEANTPLVYKHGSSSNMNVGKLSDSPSTFTGEPDREEDEANVNNISDASILDREEAGSPSISRDFSVIKEDHINLLANPCSTIAASGMIDTMTESSILVGNMTVDRNMVDQVSSHTSAKIDSDSRALLHEKDNNQVNSNKTDVDPQSSPGHVSELDTNSSKISADVSISTLDTSLEEKTKVTGVGSVQHVVSQPQHSESVVNLPFKASEKMLCEDCPKEIRSDPNQLVTSRITADSSDENHAKNHEGALKAEMGETKPSLGADSLEVACGSPTLINLGNPSQDEECRHQEAMGSGVANEFAPPDQCVSHGPKLKDSNEDDNSFTFKVNSLPEAAEGGKGNNWTPLSKAETYNPHTVVEQRDVKLPTSADIEKPDTSMHCQTISHSPAAQLARLEVTQAILIQETPVQITKASEGELIGQVSKSASGRKGRRASGKGSAKEGSSRLNSPKEATPIKSSCKGEKLPCISTSVSGVTLPASSASASPPNLAFTQPFSDAQQVQLRAQIFVYGSLIQGSAPDEGYMVSAFGPTDGERNMWESVWLTAVERVRNQKSHANLETPVHSAGFISPEAATKQGSHQSKILLSPSDRGGSKNSLTPILNPMIPLSSPLWGLPTPHGSPQPRGMQRGTVLEFQSAISPLHPYQTPPIQGFIGSTSWPSQATFPTSPWASQKSALNVSACYTPVSLTEPVKLSSVKDSSLPPSSGIKNLSTNPMALIGNPSMVFAGFPSSYPSQTVGVSSPLLSSAEPKPRRRKKSQASNDSFQNPLISQPHPHHHPQPSPQPEPLVTSPATISTVTSIAVTLPASNLPSSSTIISPACSVSPFTATSQSKGSGLDPRKCTAYSEETLRNVSEAKLQAEEAASLAASALSHSESVWSVLSKQKDLTISSETEARISSAAVAVAAAASVAKAAAAAARVASNAALQAKLMAEEALLQNSSENWSSEMQTMGEGNGCGPPGSVIVAAREAAKRRIEVATAAAKQAENLEAVVKAAELAEQAVSQAGRIVSMGEALPLKDLITAGPEGYWKLQQPPVDQVIKTDKKNNEQMNVSSLETEGGSSATRVQESAEHGEQVADLSSGSHDNHVIADDVPQSIGSVKKDGHKGQNLSQIGESGGTEPVPETDAGTGTAQRDHEDLVLLGTSICKGSVVEVYKHDGRLKPAWFLANVQALEDGKALVSYSSLLSDGSNNLQEWVALEGEENEAPRIRSTLESALDSQGTKKRRRTAMGDYTWSVGDKVDVQYQDCFWEGVVTEKNEKDETTLTVHFPARGETSAVRSWQLRPSRCWNDGKWVEWSILRGQHRESDMPLEKRQKFGSPFEVSKRIEKLPKIAEINVERPAPKRMEKLPKVSDINVKRPEMSLTLSASDKVFNVGKNTSKPDTLRTLRTGVQKEGSKVVFGVPKPGKKRKFMEVNSSGSNVPADRNDKKKGNEPAKFTKYLMPLAPTPRGGKVYSRADFKGKQTAAPKAATSSRKPLNTTLHRTTSRGEKSSKPVAAVKLDNFTDPRDDDDDFDDNLSEKPSSMDHESSSTEEVKEGPLSSLFPSQLEKLSSKADRLNRGKLGAGPSSGKFTKTVEDKVVFNAKALAPEAAEQPRRSGRRIQPTHRLLEGLQSAPVPHDRSHKMPKTPKWK